MSLYEEKIYQAKLLIEKNLSSELNWQEISRTCAISEYHFHRIFSAFVGETPRDFIIRKRLEKAISCLAYSKEVNLQELAFESGYSTQANFNKAFKAYFGVTPGQVQKGIEPDKSNIGKIKSKYGKDFKIKELYPVKKVDDDLINSENMMKFEIKEFDERAVVYVTSENGYVQESLYKTWNEFLTILSRLGNTIDELGRYGVGHDNPQVTPLEKCRYDACVLRDEIKEVPDSLKQMSFPKGKYACFYFKGSSEDLLQLYLDIYKNWFSDNGFEPGDYPLIEWYINVNQDDPKADLEVETQFLLK